MLSRRDFLRLGVGAASLAAVAPSSAGATPAGLADDKYESFLPLMRRYTEPENRPNILFISIDDMNDWVGCLGGYPVSVTPNIDRLSERSALFNHAYCSVPMCNGSRVGLWTSSQASTNGIYRNGVYFRESPTIKNTTTLSQYCHENGYYALGAGKMYCSFADPISWNEYWPDLDTQRPGKPHPPAAEKPLNKMEPALHLFDWGVVDRPKENWDDWKVASKITELLERDYDRPFFMGCGFYDCHMPWYLPKEYAERYPPEQVKLPTITAHDLRDVPATGKTLAISNNEHKLVLSHGQWQQAISHYLGSMSLVDDCVGRVLDALDKSKYRDNTIIVLWSDHGWHLGEKQHWKKRTLWEDATRNILMFAGPGIAPSKIHRPVSHIDVYPTVVDLLGLTPKDHLEGQSLTPLIEDPKRGWPRPAVMATVSTSENHLHFAVRSSHYRYIQYQNGDEELYDLATDQHEWNNLASDPKYADVKKNLAEWIPENPAPALDRTKPRGLENLSEWELEMLYD